MMINSAAGIPAAIPSRKYKISEIKKPQVINNKTPTIERDGGVNRMLRMMPNMLILRLLLLTL